jgi:hypothetical protein
MEMGMNVLKSAGTEKYFASFNSAGKVKKTAK